jgi:hypothetical protein
MNVRMGSAVMLKLSVQMGSRRPWAGISQRRNQSKQHRDEQSQFHNHFPISPIGLEQPG